MEEIVSRLSKEDDTFDGHVTPVMHRHAYEISPDADFVKLVTEMTSQVLGKPPTFIGHDWWEDSALIAEGGTETVIIGPRGAGLHTHEEWVDIQSVVDLSMILLQTAIRFCS
jgi:acetylornithine deacetylase